MLHRELMDEQSGESEEGEMIGEGIGESEIEELNSLIIRNSASFF